MTVSTNSFIKQGKSLPEKVREDMVERWLKSTVANATDKYVERGGDIHTRNNGNRISMCSHLNTLYIDPFSDSIYLP